MKIILKFLIIAQIYTSKCSVYDWNVKIIERDSDFDDELTAQEAPNNEFKNDLIKLSGELDNKNENYDPNFGKNYRFKDKAADMNKIIQDQYEYKFDGTYDDRNKDKIKQNFVNYQEKNDLNGSLEDWDKSDNFQNWKNNSDYNNLNHNHNGEGDYELNINVSSVNHVHHHTNNNFPNKFDPNKEDTKDAQNKSNEGDQQNNTNNDKKENYAIISQCPAKATYIENFVGTNLFDNIPKQCFSNEELALLNTRRDFETLLPKDLPQCLLNDHMISLLMKYFEICHQMIFQMTSNGSKKLAEKAFYDTLGGYLNFYLVPVAKFSFYGGHLSLDAVQNVLMLHQHCKQILNTNGNGWKAPLKNVLNELKTIRIEPLHINNGEQSEARNEPSFCFQLDMNREQNDPEDDKIIVMIPNLEAEDRNGYLSNVWLPFRRKRTFDLKSENAAYIVVKFYETVTKCYQFLNLTQDFYNRKFESWLLENVHIHLSDEQFYPGFGAVLRILEYIKREKKGDTSYRDKLADVEYEDEDKVKVTTARDTQDKRRKHYRIQDSIKGKDTDMKTKELDTLDNPKLEEKSKIRKDYNNDKGDSVNNSNHFNQNSSKKEQDNSKLNIANKTLKHEYIEDVKLVANIESTLSTTPIIKLRNLEFSAFQIAIISIPIAAILSIILIFCYKCCFKKKKPVVQIKSAKAKKDSSSSSSTSNLINSPVRFFNVKSKSASGKFFTSKDYSSSAPTGKKIKKTVKIQQMSLFDDSDSSGSSSPLIKMKGKAKGKDRDSAKSNSKSSWETTFSSR